MKEFAGAKQRLAPLLTPQQRQALAAAMLEDVLAALAEAPLAGIMVNTLDPTRDGIGATLWRPRRDGQRTRRPHRRGRRHGTYPCGRGPESNADGAWRYSARHGSGDRRGHRRRADRAPSLTIVPARDERGSNAVLCSPPLVMPLRFGDDSFLPHLAAARALGIEPTMVKLPGIGLDIDQPEDVDALLCATPRMATRALNVIARSGATKQTPT